MKVTPRTLANQTSTLLDLIATERRLYREELETGVPFPERESVATEIAEILGRVEGYLRCRAIDEEVAEVMNRTVHTVCMW